MSRTLLGLGVIAAALCMLPLVACVDEGANSPARGDAPARTSSAATASKVGVPSGVRSAYFGDLHVHTGYSFDAFLFGARNTPDDAYRYARGEALSHPSGYSIRLRGAPLDFLAVTDHALYMGVFRAMGDPAHELSRSSAARELLSDDPDEAVAAFTRVGAQFVRGERDERLYQPKVMHDAWQEEVAAAERHNRPGKFTTFIGYEYTSNPSYNLHRNVIFRSNAVPDLPFGALESQNPEDLWRWLDEQRERGNEALAIPHNSNWSAGHMFERQQVSGEPFDSAYAELRMRNEPLVEVTQVKGTSETHPLLSPNDEWADFEIWNVVTVSTDDGFSGQVPSTDLEHIRGGYVRDAYLAGLEFEERDGFNPYRFGLIGSSDTHNAGGTFEESSYASKAGQMDGTPERRGSVPPNGAKHWPASDERAPAPASWGASGLTAVWADSNTREEIYDAFRRKETFATTGPRLRVRFFAGFDYPENLPSDRDAVAKAYAGGVPMGGELVARDGAAPRFFAWAIRDPRSGWLERVQIVKGWIEGGATHERVFDVACPAGESPDPQTHRCPESGAQVDLSDCSTSIDSGATELSVLWRDPSFDPAERAFYYARVLETPSCRWSTWDAVRAGVPPNPALKTTIQERAWSSPVWYVP